MLERSMAGAAGGHGSAMQIRPGVANERAATLRHGLKDLRADIKQETAMAQRDLALERLQEMVGKLVAVLGTASRRPQRPAGSVPVGDY